MTRCEMCGYFWQEEDENHAYCHYDGPAQWAPCEQDEPKYWEQDDPEIWE